MALSAATIGKRIQEARQKKGYKQSYVAEKVGFSDPHLSRIENGTKPVYLHKLDMICELLDVSVVEILAGSEEPMSRTAAEVAFAEIIKDCSPETIGDMLNTCKIMAEIEKRSRKD